MARILTGIQSTGTPHLGNLLGAIIPAIQMSNNPENESFLLPDFGFGTYYYTKRFFAGLTLPNLLSNGLDIYSTTLKTNSFSFKQQHYYLYSGYVSKLNDKLLIKPSIL